MYTAKGSGSVSCKMWVARGISRGRRTFCFFKYKSIFKEVKNSAGKKRVNYSIEGYCTGNIQSVRNFYKTLYKVVLFVL